MADIQSFVSVLWNSRTQAHIWHNQTDSFSEHKALEHFYSSIVPLTDSLVESIQGIYPRIKGYSSTQYVDWTGVDQTKVYFKGLYDYISMARKEIYQESWIQNQIDELEQLVAETLYQLSLK